MAPSVSIRSLHYQYFDGAPFALKDLSVHIASGSCTALLGPSGAGKTTLLQILSGIIGAQFTTGKASGSVLIGDDEFRPIPQKVLFPSVGYLMQDASVQLSGIKETVEEELAFALDNMGIDGYERRERVSQALSRLDLGRLANRRPHQLSGGELQRTALASILVARPSLLVLDEPVNALDSLGQQRMVNVLRSLKSSTTVLFADSGIEFALAVADTFLVMQGGSILFSGTRNQFLNSLDSFYDLLPVNQWSEVVRKWGKTTVHPRVAGLLSL